MNYDTQPDTDIDWQRAIRDLLYIYLPVLTVDGKAVATRQAHERTQEFIKANCLQCEDCGTFLYPPEQTDTMCPRCASMEAPI